VVTGGLLMTEREPTTFAFVIDVLSNEQMIQVFDAMSLDNATEDDIKSLLFEMWDRLLLTASATKTNATEDER
jgi:hypothetical protein